jgi:hypothetical protein
MPRVLRKTRIREPGNVVVTTMPGPRVPKLYNGNSKAAVLDYLSTIVSPKRSGTHNRDGLRSRWQASASSLAVRISLFVRAHVCGTFADERIRTLARCKP